MVDYKFHPARTQTSEEQTGRCGPRGWVVQSEVGSGCWCRRRRRRVDLLNFEGRSSLLFIVFFIVQQRAPPLPKGARKESQLQANGHRKCKVRRRIFSYSVVVVVEILFNFKVADSSVCGAKLDPFRPSASFNGNTNECASVYGH